MTNTIHPVIHDMKGMPHVDVYDTTQTSDAIRDGDVLIVDGGLIIMVGAWPALFDGQSNVFQRLGDGKTWATLEGGRYAIGSDFCTYYSEGSCHTTQTDGLVNFYVDGVKVAVYVPDTKKFVRTDGAQGPSYAGTIGHVWMALFMEGYL